MDKVRYAWPDVLKFFGILLVLWMHVNIVTHANWNILIFAWQVIPLFFFCSGFFFSHSAKLTFFQYIRKLLFHLVVPYLFFTAFSALLFFTAEKCGMETGLRLPGPMNLVLMTCAGMRDYLFLPASWFFPALFCLSAAAFIARRFAEKISEKAAVRNGILLGIGVVCWIFSVFCRAFFLTHEVMGRRGLCLPWCLDWGLMFFFYYILGSILFPWLCEFHFARLSQAKKFLWGTVCGLSMLYVVLCIAFPGFGTFGLPDPTRHTFLFFLYQAAVSVPMLIALVSLAKLMDKDGLMAKFGRETLLLCCLEIVYLFCRIVLRKLTGIRMIPESPLDGLVFAFIQILFCCFILIPVFRKFLPFFCGIGRKPGTPGPAGKGA